MPRLDSPLGPHLSTKDAALLCARRMLQDITPLHEDCGGFCDGACCKDDAQEGLGMLLFPGEAELYTPEDAAWMTIVPSHSFHNGRAVSLLICHSACPRDRRPLACRIFPLIPQTKGQTIALRIDARGASICPLISSGVDGLSQDFVLATEQAFALLFKDPTQRDFLLYLSRQVDSYLSMRRKLYK